MPVLVKDAFQPRLTFTAVEREGDVSLTLHSSSQQDAQRQALEKALILWMNENLKDNKLAVREFARDLHTGEIFLRLLGTLTGKEIAHNRLAQSDTSHKQNIQVLLDFAQALGLANGETRWSVDDVYGGNWASLYSLSVALARHFNCPYELPTGVQVNMVRREMIKGGTIVQKTVSVLVNPVEQRQEGKLLGDNTSESQDASQADDEEQQARWGPVASDVEGDGEDEPLCETHERLVEFANKHLACVDRHVVDISHDFAGGDLFVILLGVLGRFFVPLSNYAIAPQSLSEKVNNVRYAFRLMDEMGISRRGIRSADVAQELNGAAQRMLHNISKAT